MLHGRTTAGPWVVETWERSRDPDSVARDALLVDLRPDCLRVAVIDGVTPTPATPGVAGIDGAVWASALVRAALLARRPLRECAQAVHEVLLDGEPVPTPRDRPQACFAAADVSPTGVRVLRAGDCEAWCELPNGWRRLFPREIDTPAERARMLRWTRDHPDRPYLEYDRSRPDGGDVWFTAALGRLRQPLLQARDLGACQSLVLATDGARLRPRSLALLDEWLSDIERLQNRHAVSRWEGGPDDMAVVRVRRST